MGSHPSYHRGAKDLVYIHVHKFEGARLRMKSSMARTIRVGGQFLGSRYLFFHGVNHGCYAFFVWNVSV